MSFPYDFSDHHKVNLFSQANPFGWLNYATGADDFFNVYNRLGQTYLPEDATIECGDQLTCDNTDVFTDGAQVGDMRCTSKGDDPFMFSHEYIKFNGVCRDEYGKDPLVPLERKNGCERFFIAMAVPDDPTKSADDYSVPDMRSLRLCTKCGSDAVTCLTPEETTKDPSYPSYYRRMANYEKEHHWWQ